jgi:secreted trypsin-like serine protease
MRKNVLILFAILAMLSVTVIPAAAITWGEPDTEHTNVGAMMMVLPGWGNTPVCSGTLIHPQIFLTAGHCTDGVDAGEVWVNFNQDGTNLKGILDVAQVITHPDYWWGPTSNPHDVGVLILAKKVKNRIEPAKLPKAGFLDELLEEGKLQQGSDGAKFTMVGYGASLEWPPQHTYYEDQRQSSESEYQALLKSWLRLSQNQATDDGGTCSGDSGGPAFYEQDGTEILVGVTSWGDTNCIASGFNYRVDIPETLYFIDDVISSLD